MSSPARFGRITPPDEAWLARLPPEPVIDPELPIIDTHHHLWDRGGRPYLLDEFLADLRTGHNTVRSATAPMQASRTMCPHAGRLESPSLRAARTWS
jgi:hypothetical protein